MRIELHSNLELTVMQAGTKDGQDHIFVHQKDGTCMVFPLNEGTLEKLEKNILYKKCKLILEIEVLGLY